MQSEAMKESRSYFTETIEPIDSLSLSLHRDIAESIEQNDDEVKLNANLCWVPDRKTCPSHK